MAWFCHCAASGSGFRRDRAHRRVTFEYRQNKALVRAIRQPALLIS